MYALLVRYEVRVAKEETDTVRRPAVMMEEASEAGHRCLRQPHSRPGEHPSGLFCWCDCCPLHTTVLINFYFIFDIQLLL